MSAPSRLHDAESPAHSNSNRDLIVAELARYLFETEERLDSGRADCQWEQLGDYDRAFYIECVWALLSRRSLVMRFFELPDCNFVIGGTVATEEPHGRPDP